MRKGIRTFVAGAAAALLLLAAGAFGADEKSLDDARALVLASRPFVEKANDIDLDMDDRKAPRKEAFKRLKEARELYDRYLDANPAQEEKLDKEYVEMMVLLHGIKKDSGLGELEKDDDAPSAPVVPGPVAPPAPGTPQPATPAPDASERARTQLAAVREFEKAHPGDLPQIQKLYARFLADFPDPTLPEYTDAADRLGKVSERIKTVFQTSAKRDWDSLSGSDSKDEKTFVFRLTTDLSSKDPDVRRRAAQILASTRSRSATFFLARGICDRDEAFAKVCRDGLIVIGGTTMGESLVKLYRDTPKEKQHAAMDVFAEAVKKGAFEAVNQSRSIGRFTLSNEGPVALKAFELLTSMGKLGGPGLVVALDSRSVEKKVYAMRKMVEARYWKGATLLALRFLVEGKGAGAEALRAAATDTITKMGAYAVPYLIDPLHGPSGKYTGVVLSTITGLHVETDERQKVRDWWERNRPSDAD